MGTNLNSSFCSQNLQWKGAFFQPSGFCWAVNGPLAFKGGNIAYNTDSYFQLSSLLLPPAFWLNVGSKKHAIKYEEMKINDTVHCTLQSAWQKECCLQRPSGPVENAPLPKKMLGTETVTQVLPNTYCCSKPNKLQV